MTLHQISRVLATKVIVAALLTTCLIGCTAEPIRLPEPKPAPQVNVLAFTAPWCRPCRLQHPALVVLEARGLKVHHFNYDINLLMVKRHKVESVPTYIVREGRKEILRTNDVRDLVKYVK